MTAEESSGSEPERQAFEPSTTAWQERLDRIEQLLVKLDQRFDEQALAKRSWQAFCLLLVFHCLGVAIAFTLDGWLDGVAMWGWLAGAYTTLCTWHGLSLRPFLQRWLRSCIAVIVVATTVVFVYDTSPWDLVEVSLPWITLCGFGAILAAMFVRSLFHCGYAAPDGVRIRCDQITLYAIFKFSSLFALLFACCRYMAWWFSTTGATVDPGGVLPIALLGIGQGGMLSAALILWFRDTRWFRRVLILPAVLLLGFILNLLLYAIASLLLEDGLDLFTSWNEFLGFIPYFAIFTVAQTVPPVLSAILLHSAGHRIAYIVDHNSEES